MTHSINIRIYYEDTDAGGVVYNANYLKFAERGRTEFLRAMGHQSSDLKDQFDILLVVRRAEVEYIKPAFLDDLLRLETSVEDLKNTSLVMRQRVYNQDTCIADMKVVIVSVNANTIKPVKMPDILKAEFKNTIG